MLKRVVGLAIVVMGWVSTTPIIAQVGPDDFLPPVQGGTREVKEADKVKVDKNLISAATAQDAMNSAVKENIKGAKESPDTDMGARMVKFPSGLGFVATGVTTYSVHENPTATRISQRQAYVVAFAKAKVNLAKILKGQSTEGKTTIRESLKTVTLPNKEDLTNISSDTEDSITQAVDMMLRGFVIYEVKDDPKEKMVTVSIVTTPKTRGKLARPAPNAIEVDSLRDGINQVLQEVKSGVVPPVGGRIIIMRSTGETAFVGFGSSIIRSNKNPAVQAKLNLAALRIADQYSVDSLCGLIIGDKTTWMGTVVDKLKEENKDFDEAGKGDPLGENNPAGIKKLEKARDVFVNTLRTEDVLTSARKGMIPPGVISRSWFDEDRTWAFAMSVYVPSASKAAAQTAKEMQETLIVRPDGQPSVSGIDPKSGFSDPKKGIIKPGPTGKIGNEKDM